MNPQSSPVVSLGKAKNSVFFKQCYISSRCGVLVIITNFEMKGQELETLLKRHWYFSKKSVKEVECCTTLARSGSKVSG